MLNNRKLFRLIIPSFPNFNIYSRIAIKTTAYGPVCVGTMANQLKNWDVEIIDENNCQSKFCPKTKQGLVDHKKLQQLRPADVVGFYGSLTSTVPRIFELAKLYKDHDILTITGGKHVENLPEESLDNNIDIVVVGDGEKAIQEVLVNFENEKSFHDIEGLVFKENKQVYKTPARELMHNFEDLPLPEFHLIRYANIKIFPISRIRGCNMCCEFCAVKDKARYATPVRMMKQIAHLVENYGARNFFESSDHFAPDKDDAIEFCRLLEAYQKANKVKIKMTVQIRLNDAQHDDLLLAMKRAGIHNVCIGYESPIDEELIAMKKGYLSKDMQAWTKKYHSYGFFIHGMFIFGYPYKKESDESRVTNEISIEEKVKRFKKFIFKSRIDTVQLLLTIPLPGTELRKRLEAENRVYDIGWEYYDGQFPLFKPDFGVEPEAMQQAVTKIMRRFYGVQNLAYIIINIVINFPIMLIPSAFSLFSMRARYLIHVFKKWYRFLFRNQSIRFGGHFIVKGWFKNFKKGKFTSILNNAKNKLLSNLN